MTERVPTKSELAHAVSDLEASIDALERRVTDAEAQRDEYLQDLQRLAADFDNDRKRVARDQKILARVETSAAELQEALTRVLKEPEKKGKLRRVGPVLLVGGAATAVFVFLRKRGGGIGPEEKPY